MTAPDWGGLKNGGLVDEVVLLELGEHLLEALTNLLALAGLELLDGRSQSLRLDRGHRHQLVAARGALGFTAHLLALRGSPLFVKFKADDIKHRLAEVTEGSQESADGVRSNDSRLSEADRADDQTAPRPAGRPAAGNPAAARPAASDGESP